MAKEELKTKTQPDDPEFDFDWDYDSEMDAGIEQAAPKPRHPAINVVRGTLSGALEYATDPKEYKDVLKRTLPPTYGDIARGMSDVTKGVTDLYDQAKKEVKPRANTLIKRADAIIPDNFKTTKKILDKLNSWTGGRKDYGGSDEQNEEDSVQQVLGEIFTVQQEQDKAEKVRQIAKDNVDLKRHNQSIQLTSQMQQDISTMAQYTVNVTQAYQRKSLEVMIRGFMLQQKTAEATIKHFERSEALMEATVKNTGLPDWVKITKTEAFQERMTQRMVDGLFGDKSPIGKGMDKLKKKAGDFFDGLGRGLEGAAFQLEDIQSAQDQIKMLKEMAAEAGMSTDELTASHMLGANLGSFAAGEAKDALIAKLRPLADKNPKLKEKLAHFSTYFTNTSGKIDTFRKGDKWQGYLKKDGFLGKLFNIFDEVPKSFMDEDEDREFSSGNDLSRLGDPAQGLTTKFTRSVEEVIPGYLSLILREIAGQRTGKEAPLTVFDYSKGKFTTSSKLKSDLMSELKSDIENSMVGYATEQAQRVIVGNDPLSAEDGNGLRKLIRRLAVEKNLDFANMDAVKETDAFKAAPPQVQKMFLDAYGAEDAEDKQQRIAKISKTMADVRGSHKGLNERLDRYVKAGYGNLLEEEKLMKLSDDGKDFIVDEDEFERLTESNSSFNQRQNSQEYLDFLQRKQEEKAEREAEERERAAAGIGPAYPRKARSKAEREQRKAEKAARKQKRAADKAQAAREEAERNMPPTINSDYFDRLDQYGDEDDYFKSDINTKENITPQTPKSIFDQLKDKYKDVREAISSHAKGSGKQALEGASKTRLFSWKYKKGQGSQEQNMGAMAQDVRRNLGDKAAPQGREINLQGLTASFFAGMQYLSESQERISQYLQNAKNGTTGVSSYEDDDPSANDASFKTGSSKGRKQPSHLAKLSKDVVTIRDNIITLTKLNQDAHDRLKDMSIQPGAPMQGQAPPAHDGSYLGMISSLLGKGISDVSSGVSTVAGGLNKHLLSPLWNKAIVPGYEKGSKLVKDNYQGVFDSILGIGKKGFDIGSDILTNKIPKAFGSVGDILSSIWKTGKSMFQEVKDVYVVGMLKPALEAKRIKAGMYMDELTGKALLTMDDILKCKNNIVDEAGNIMLSVEDKAKGVYDRHGRRLLTGAAALLRTGIGAAAFGIDKALGLAGSIFKTGSKGFKGIKDWMSSKLQNGFPGVLGFGLGEGSYLHKAHDILYDIRDLMLGRKKDVLKRMKLKAEQLKEQAFKSLTSAALGAAGVKGQEAGDGNAQAPNGTGLLGNILSGNFVRNSLFGAAGAAVGRKLGVAQPGDAEFVGPMRPGDKAQEAMGPNIPFHLRAKRAAEGALDRIKGSQAYQSAAAQASSGVGLLGGLLAGNLTSGDFADPEAILASGKTVDGKPLSWKDKKLLKLQAAKLKRQSNSSDAGPRMPDTVRMQRAADDARERAAQLREAATQRATSMREKAAAKFASLKEKVSLKTNPGQMGPQLPPMVGPQLPGKKAGFLGKLKGMKIGGKIGSVLSAGANLAGGLLGSMGGADKAQSSTEESPQGPTPEQEAQREAQKNKPSAFSLIKSSLAKLGGKVSGKDRAWNDKDGSGDRDNGMQDQQAKIDAIAESRKKDFQAADTRERYGSSENVIDKMLNASKSFMAGVTDKISSIAGIAGDLFTSIPGVGKVASGIRGVLGSLGSKLGLLKSAGAAGNVAKVGRLAKFGRAALTVGRTGLAVGRTAFAVARGAVMFAGLLGQAATAVTTVMASAISLPVLLTVAAIAGTAYVGYKLYQHANRNNASEFEKLRLRQYGLAYNSTVERYNHKAYILEAYLEDGRVEYRKPGGMAYLVQSKIKPDELRDIFGIGKADEEKARAFSDWFDKRFKPVFLAHKTALNRVNPGLKLPKVNELKAAEKVEYLEMVKLEPSVYRHDVSPIEGLESLNVNSDEIEEYRKILLENNRTLAIKEAKKDQLPKVLPKETEEKAKSAAEEAAKRKEKAKHENEIALAKERDKAVAATTAATATIAGGEGDGAKPEGGGTAATGTSGAVTGGMPPLAQGARASGEQGLQHVTLKKDATLDGMLPAVLRNFLGMAQEYGTKTGKKIPVNDGKRTRAQQEALARKYPGKAAAPGKSLHEFGLAIDADSSVLNELEKLGLMRKYGFTRPVGQEPWHMEPSGIQRNIPLAKQGGSTAEAMVDSSIGRGGGGYGTVPSAAKYKRNHQLAMQLYDNGGMAGDAAKIDDKALAATEAGKANLDTRLENSVKPPTSEEKTSSDPITQQKVGTKESKSNDLPPTPTSTRQGDTLPDQKDQALKNTAGGSGWNPGERLDSGEGDGANPGTGSGSGGGEGGKGDVKSIIKEAAQKANVDPNTLMLFAAQESSLNPNARTKAKGQTAGGLLGFIDKTWNAMLSRYGRKYGLAPNTSKMDPRASALMGAEYIKENQKIISAKKPNPTPVESYFAHFLGGGGASKFFGADPTQVAAEVLPDAAANNSHDFYANGRPLTIKEVFDKKQKALINKASEFGINIQASTMTGGPSKEAANDTSMAPELSREKAAMVSSTTPKETRAANDAAIAPSPKPSSPSPTGMTMADVGKAAIMPKKNEPNFDLMALNPMAQPKLPERGASPASFTSPIIEETLKESLSELKGIHGLMEKLVKQLSPEEFAKVAAALSAKAPTKGDENPRDVQKQDQRNMERRVDAGRSSLDFTRKSA